MPLSPWTPLKPHHSNHNPNPNCLANQLWCIDFLTRSTPLIIPHRLPAFLESLMPLKNWCSTHARWSESSLKHSIRFSGILSSSLKQNLIAYRSSKVSSRPDCIIFEIHQLWQSGFSRVYSNSCCRCSFEPELIKIGQSSHDMYSNNILNFQKSMTILNACTKKSGNLLKDPRTCHQQTSTLPMDNWVKRKETEKIIYFWNFVRKLKKLWNMKIAVTPNLAVVLGIIPKGLKKMQKE